MGKALVVIDLVCLLFLAPVAQAQDGILDTIYDRAAAHGVSGAWMERVARCESSLNPRAIGRLGERGLFQLNSPELLNTFYRWGYSDPFNAWEASDFTARAFAQGLAYLWSCR